MDGRDLSVRPVGIPRRLPQWRAGLGQYLQLADDVRDVQPRSRRLHPGSMDPDDKADAESRVARRVDLRIDAVALPGADDLHRRTVLSGNQGHSVDGHAVAAIWRHL